MMNAVIADVTITPIFANIKNVLIVEGESNGRDDSDGFVTYYNVENGQIETDRWTTRAYCPFRGRDGVKEFMDLADEEKAIVHKKMAERALEILEKQAKNEWTLKISRDGNYKELPIVVSGGRLFKGKGLLTSIETSCYRYGYNRESVNRRAFIKTDSGDVKRANADYVEVDLDAIDLAEVADKFAFEILREDGYDGNIVRYSTPKRLGDFVVRMYKA